MGNKLGKVTLKGDLTFTSANPEVVARLAQIPVLAHFSEDDISKASSKFSLKTYAAGDTIIRQGEKGDGFYIIDAGSVTVEAAKGDKSSLLNTLSANDFFGETALLGGAMRNSTITAVEATRCFFLGKNDFLEIFNANFRFNKKKKAVTAGHEQGNYERKADAVIEKGADTVEFIRQAVKDNILFTQVHDDVAMTLISEMHMENISAGEAPITQGDSGDFFYVVQSGNFQVLVNGKRVAERGAGTAFGELALLYNAPRAATVAALEDSVVWVIHRSLFRNIVQSHAKGMMANFTSFLKKVPLFEPLRSSQIRMVAEALEEKTFAADSVIFKQDHPGTFMYILKKGQVEITKDGETLCKYDKPGSFFGERALLKSEPRAGSAIAKKTTTLLVIDKATFEVVLGPLSEILEKTVGSYTSSAARKAEEKKSNNRATASDDWTPIPLEKLKCQGTLGKGSFGHVTLVINEDNPDQTFALKAIKKAMIVETSQQGHVMSEKRVMMQLRHPFLIRLYQTYNHGDNLYFLLEPIMGGELFTFLRKEAQFTDKTARFYAACVVLSFEYMHSFDIIYRDLKPENLLLDNKGYIKITDFGFAKKIEDRTWTLCGTPDYLAPEIVKGYGHGKGVDWWTLGILIYEMLEGQPPFYDEDPMKTYNLIVAGELRFGGHFTAPARSLIKKLLSKKPTRRLGVVKGGATLIKRHVWFQSYNKQFAETGLTGWDELFNKNVKAPMVPNISNAVDLSNFDFDEDLDDEDDVGGAYIDDGSGWDAEF